MQDKSILQIVVERSVFIGLCITTIGTFLAACFTNSEPHRLGGLFMSLFIGGFLVSFFYYLVLILYLESRTKDDDSIMNFKTYQQKFNERNK
jgi:hypothetical protein